MGADHARARGSLRFTLGWTSTEADVDALGAALGEVVERARRAGRQAGLYTARSAGSEVAAQPDGPPGLQAATHVAGQAAAP